MTRPKYIDGWPVRWQWLGRRNDDAHLDYHVPCRENPMALCSIGQALLERTAGSGMSPVERQERMPTDPFYYDEETT